MAKPSAHWFRVVSLGCWSFSGFLVVAGMLTYWYLSISIVLTSFHNLHASERCHDNPVVECQRASYQPNRTSCFIHEERRSTANNFDLAKLSGFILPSSAKLNAYTSGHKVFQTHGLSFLQSHHRNELAHSSKAHSMARKWPLQRL